MREKFNSQLKLLNDSLILMGAQCEDCISYAMESLVSGNQKLAESAKQMEKEIDEKEQEIKSLCMKLLLQQQPVARDLKIISAALKMIVDMERIGDQGSDIARIVQKMNFDSFEEVSKIYQMADVVVKMIIASVNAFVHRSAEEAKEVDKMDDTIDSMFYEIKQDLIELIFKDKQKGEKALETLMIAKYLERIGDHVVNVAESVIAMLE